VGPRSGCQRQDPDLPGPQGRPADRGSGRGPVDLRPGPAADARADDQTGPFTERGPSRWRSEPFRTRPDNGVARRGVPGMSKSKLVMIAVDAADRGLVRKWADKGHLPTFARLLADGLMRRCGPITGRLRGLASGTRRGGSAEGQPASSLPRPGGLGLLLRSVLRITLRGPSILALDGRESPSPRCLRSARLALGYPGRLRGHRCRS
jgi:hypothetical protein